MRQPMYKKITNLVLLSLLFLYVLFHRSRHAASFRLACPALSAKYPRISNSKYLIFDSPVHRHSDAIYHWLYSSRCDCEIALESGSTLPPQSTSMGPGLRYNRINRAAQ